MSLQTLILSVFLLVCLPLSLSLTPESFGKAAADSVPYPVIGIFTQPSPFAAVGYPSTEFSYIAGSYIKHIESAGATVVPIQWDLPYDELDILISKLNGVLFPGGGTGLVNHTSGNFTAFTLAGQHIINKAMELHDNGDYFPVWATCLGYELLVLTMSGNTSLLINILDGDDIAKTLNLTTEGMEGMYGQMEPDLLTQIQTANLSYFHHKHTPDPAGWTNDTMLATNFTVTAWTFDNTSDLYAASIQGIVYPFLGTQFHPEKNTYEWYKETTIPHSLNATRVQQYYTYFFVNETMSSSHRFDSIEDLEKSWIYNYQPKHFGPDPEFEQVYVFPNYLTYDKSIKLIDEYPKGFEPTSDETDKTEASESGDSDSVEGVVPEVDEILRFKEVAPFLFNCTSYC